MAIETFVLSSENTAKREATLRFLQGLYGNAVVLKCVNVESGEAETPTTDEAGIRGASTRNDNAERLVPGASGYIGLEGIVTFNMYGAFLCGWAAVRLQSGLVGYGCSAKVRLPDELVEGFSGFAKLSEMTAQLYPDQAALLPEIGTNGVVTRGAYTRVDEFTDALQTAFGSLYMPTA